MNLTEIQEVLTLIAPLLFPVIIGALLVGLFFSIIAFMLRHALAIIGIAALVAIAMGVQLVP